MAQRTYDSLEDIAAGASSSIRPPDRITVSQAAEKYRHINNPGNYVGPFKVDMAPYMREPQDELTSLDYVAEIFAGPAQCGKTEAGPNWITHSVKCDPADMMFVSPTHAAARDFSKRRLSRLYRDTPALREEFLPGKQGTNVFDTQFKSGMLLTLAHPSISELSGKPIPRIWLTDYDRDGFENVDGEGSAFDLARKRTTTFRRFGMTVAESSPGHVVENPKWIANSPHEAPPTRGILALYNRGDRRRWYWKCPHCEEAFEPSFHLMRWPDSEDRMFSAENAYLECPKCGDSVHHTSKHELNLAGRWIKDGMIWRKDGSITGRPYRSNIASFWLKGVAASFIDWKDLVLNYLKACEEFDRTGSEEALKTTVNTDQGEPYIPKATMTQRLPEELKARAEPYGTQAEPVVPYGVRFLLASVDVQGGLKPCFVVHVFGVGEGGDIWHVDMFKIRKSDRKDEDGDSERIDPAAYPEDWQVLVDQVIERAYPLEDESGRVMQVKMTCCDSGGQAGVTTNAYKFWRWLKKHGEGHHQRFQLVKGESSKNAQRYVVKYPDSQRRDRNAGARGDVPVGFIHSNEMKDTVSAMLGRTEPGGGMVHFPDWAPDWLYMQLTAEVRTPKGWESTSRRRNEAFDLLYYVRALFIDKRLRVETIDWSKPPGWAAEWDKNDLVAKASAVRRFSDKTPRRSLSDLGSKLA